MQEDYERSLRQPLGREYNPDKSFRDLTRPAILKSTGVTIEPIRYSAKVSEHNASRAGKAGVGSGVVRVQGGMPMQLKGGDGGGKGKGAGGGGGGGGR